jgi:hypothetical protein
MFILKPLQSLGGRREQRQLKLSISLKMCQEPGHIFAFIAHTACQYQLETPN